MLIFLVLIGTSQKQTAQTSFTPCCSNPNFQQQVTAGMSKQQHEEWCWRKRELGIETDIERLKNCLINLAAAGYLPAKGLSCCSACQLYHMVLVKHK